MKASKQYFPVVLFFMSNRWSALAFQFVDEILRCDHLNAESS